MTATQLAARLELTPNNVYHHMRVLRRLGVVEPPRAVPGPTYVEKYYRVRPDVTAAISHDPYWLDKAMGPLASEDRQAIVVDLCLTAAQLLTRAARLYREMEVRDFDDLMSGTDAPVMVSVNAMGRDRLVRRLKALRRTIAEEAAEEREPNAADTTDAVIMAGLPLLWKGRPCTRPERTTQGS